MGRIAALKPSPATAIALLALLVAMGGTGYAALSLPPNSVGTEQLKKNAVTTKKIKDGAVDGSKVRANSLTGRDINVATLGKVPSAASADRATTATTAGTATSAGTASALDKVTYVSHTCPEPSGQHTLCAVQCPASMHPTGGGGLSFQGNLTVALNSSLPVGSDGVTPPGAGHPATGWLAVGGNGSGLDLTITTWAVCTTINSVTPS